MCGVPGQQNRNELIAELEEKARRIRVLVVKMAGMSDCHTGGALSMADILAVLYFRILTLDPRNPQWSGRDYFILSKGHCVPSLDAALAMRGFFPEETLTTHLERDSMISGHACARLTPGIDVSTGSLGHGLSIGVGCALGIKMDREPNRVFVVLGDGELQEGSNWEAVMAAAHHRLDNLVAIVDRNWYQTGATEEMMRLEPLADKWASFGWSVLTIDGHDVAAIVDTLESVPFEQGRPSVVIANTVKGKGVSFIETRHMARFDEAQLRAALHELGA
ncbi:MAG: transketolase [Chloroflexi bacterium]|nr:transketolase [Chloroflexota bacterium]